MKRTNILWITVLALGWLFDFLFWKRGFGINFAIYAVLCLAGGLLVLGLNGFKTTWKSLLLLVPILFFAVMSFIRIEPLTMFLTTVFTLALMGLLAVTYLGGRWPAYGLADYIVNAFKLVGSLIARPLMFVTSSARTVPVEAAPAPRPGAKRVWAVLRGILIAIPIVAIFAALLSSADLVFAQRVQDVVSIFRIQNLPQYILRCVLILMAAYALAGVFLHAATQSRDEKLVGADKPLVAPFLGFTEAAVVLGAVVILFALFAIVQFRYFFGGVTNIGVNGYTYAEYARRGFSELVLAAFFSLLLFLGLSAIVKRQTPVQRRVFSGLGMGMVLLVGVMLYSAFRRLLLYEAAYGFSRLRMYTHVFMIWLALLLVAVVVLEFLRRERVFTLALLLAAIGFTASLALVNVDGFIVRQNVAHAAGSDVFDMAYLASLSTDSVPSLVAGFQNQSLPAATRDAIGAALVCHQQLNSSRRDTDWRSFTLSNWLAERAFSQVQSSLGAYQVTGSEWPYKVYTPAYMNYECADTGGL